MKVKPSQKIRIGIFTIAGIVLLVAGIFIIGQKKNMFGNTFIVYGRFKTVGGLQLGNNVRFDGINVGTVKDITIENDTTVRVGMRLQAKVRPFLKKDAVASIGSDGLMGDKLVTISPGTYAAGPLGNHDEINTVEPANFDKIINRISNVAANAETITASLADISTQISSGKGSLGRLIYKDSLEKGLLHTVQAAKQGAQGFNDNMKAMKHNFLLRGYFKHKAKDSLKQKRKEERKERKEERRR